MSHAFTRTQSTRSSQVRLRMASTTLARAATFSFGRDGVLEVEEGEVGGRACGALARKRSDEPGVDRQERRGRLRERSDMSPSLCSAKSCRCDVASITRRFWHHGTESRMIRRLLEAARAVEPM